MAVPVYALGPRRHVGRAGAARRAGALLRRRRWRWWVGRVAGPSTDGRGWPLAVRRTADRAGTWCAVIVALALVAAAADPFIVKIFVNGMESGVLVLFDAAVLAIGATWRGRLLRRGTPAARWATGLLLAGLVLARTDSVLLLAVMGVWALAEARSGWRRSVVPLLQLFALPGLVLIAYLVSNQVMFGVLLQISGLTKRAPFTLERVVWFTVALAGRGVDRPVGVPAVADDAWARPVRSRRRLRGLDRVVRRVLRAARRLLPGLPDPAVALVLRAAGDLPALPARDRRGRLRRGGGGRGPGLERRPGRLLPVSAILLLPLVAGDRVRDPRVRRSARLFDRHRRSRRRACGSIATCRRGRCSPRGMPGVLGYYARRPVINLDGVANSYAYYQASRNGTVGRFLTDRHLAGVVNLGTPVGGQDPGIVAYVRDTLGARAAAGLRLAQSWPFTYSGTTTGAAGAASGTRQLAVFLYLLAPPYPLTHLPLGTDSVQILRRGARADAVSHPVGRLGGSVSSGALRSFDRGEPRDRPLPAPQPSAPQPDGLGPAPTRTPSPPDRARRAS